MKAANTFEVIAREDAGKGAARALRREGKIPAILYGNSQSPTKIAMPLKELTLEYRKGSFFNKIMAVKLEGKVIHVLPRDVQMHPVTDVIEHADFQRVEKDSKIHVFVPVRVLNQEKSIGLKRGGVLNIVRHEIELICTPENIPPYIEVDVLNIDIGRSVHISAVTLPPNVTTAIKDRDFTVVAVAGRSKEEEEIPTAAAAVPGAEGAAAAGTAAATTPAAGAAAAPGAKPAAGKDEKKK